MMHPACGAKLPANGRAGKCTTDGCSNSTSSNTLKLCTFCSASTGSCESCGKTLIKKQTNTPTAITGGGGCMNPRGQGVNAANGYFPTLPGYVTHEIKGDVITVTLDGEVPTTWPKRFWTIFKVVYVTANQPVPPAANVMFVFKGTASAAQQNRVLDSLKRYPGVVSVLQTYPDGESPNYKGWGKYFERFHTVGLSDATKADEVLQVIQDFAAVEEAQHDPLA